MTPTDTRTPLERWDLAHGQMRATLAEVLDDNKRCRRALDGAMEENARLRDELHKTQRRVIRLDTERGSEGGTL